MRRLVVCQHWPGVTHARVPRQAVRLAEAVEAAGKAYAAGVYAAEGGKAKKGELVKQLEAAGLPTKGKPAELAAR